MSAKSINIESNKLLIVALSIIFTLVALEVVCRVWINLLAPDDLRNKYSLYKDLRSENRRYVRHHYLNYYLNPEYRGKHTYHNSLGYRNDEIPVEKPEGVFRIAALGGSTTYTIKVGRNENTFTGKLEEILRDEYGYENIEVINAGVGGYNSWESLINLQFRVLDLDPDLIIVYHGVNDVHTRLVDPEHYRGDNSGRRKQWYEPAVRFLEHSALMRTVLRKTGLTEQYVLMSFVNADSSYGPFNLEGKDPMELLDKNPPDFFKRNLRNMAAVSRANGAEILFSTWAHSPYFDDYISTEHYQRALRENNEAVIEVAEDMDVPVFDFAEVMPQQKEYWDEGRHVNKFGAEKKAELFSEFINEMGLIPK